MRKFMIAAVVLVASVHAADAAAPPPQDDDSVLERAVAVGRKYDLLLPPSGARLVWYQREKTDEARLAFLIEEKGKKAKRWLIVGDRIIDPIPGEAVIAQAKPTGISDRVEEAEYHWLPAVRCYALGHRDLARALLRKYKVEHPAPTSREVREAAYWSVLDQFQYPQTDRKLVLRHLENFRASGEAQGYEDELKHLIDCLRASLAPQKERNGKVEKLVERLLDDPFGEPRQTLERLNFDAVPTLIGYLGDKRLTRRYCCQLDRGLLHAAGCYLTLEELVWQLLAEIAGPALSDLKRMDKTKALAWWKAAQKTGEEANSVALVFPKGARSVNRHHLAVLRERYPKQLPQLYKRVVEARVPPCRPCGGVIGGRGSGLLPRLIPVDSSEVAKAIRNSNLPEKVKQEALRLGADRPEDQPQAK
jgi:hypothetical protein